MPDARDARQAHGRQPLFQFMVLDHCVNAGFYGMVTAAALAFLASWWLPQAAQTDDYMAGAWVCIFGAALCLLMRLAVLVWEDLGESGADQAS